MKHEIYRKYLREVMALYRIRSTETLFSTTRRREIVDARQLLFLLLQRRPMKLTEIKKFVETDGCTLNKSNIMRGARNAYIRMLEDKDVRRIVEDIEIRNG